MGCHDTIEISHFLGKVFTSIEVADDNSEIVFSIDGRPAYRMHHIQDCCEGVALEDVSGDLSDLIASPIMEAECVTNCEDDPPESAESWTWTFYKLGTRKGHVTLRWLGESTGYYSEDVDIQEIGTGT